MQLNASAFSVKQLQRLKNESGITTFDSDIEVFNPEIFKRICPGKERYVGYNEWKKRIFDAVDVFGRGYVNSAQVIGVEFSGKEGFTSEEEAFEDNMKYAEEFVKHDVALTLNVWSPCKGSILFRENNPSLEYYVRLAKGYADLHRQYKISIIPDDYRRCSNHINMDFDRLIDFQG
jgi:biotin synthase-related radical SAM superfamily protein